LAFEHVRLKKGHTVGLLRVIISFSGGKMYDVLLVKIIEMIAISMFSGFVRVISLSYTGLVGMYTGPPSHKAQRLLCG
jgi:hypothetical protein